MRVKRTVFTSLFCCAFVVALATFNTGCGKTEPAPAEKQDLSQSPDLFSQPVKNTVNVDPNAVIVVVEGKEITRGEIDEQVGKMMEMARRRVPPERLAQMQGRFAQQAVDNLILKTLLTKAIDKENIQVTDEEVTEALDKYKESLPPGMEIKDLIERNQWTQEEFDKNLRLDLRINKLLENQVADMGEPSDEEIADFYKENIKHFSVPESVTARHILIATTPEDTDETKAAKKKQAEELREKLVAGADFAELAKDHSDCPSKSRGGELPEFSRGQMVKPFEDAAFSQKIDEIGPVVETRFGYHIIQVEKHQDAEKKKLDDPEVKDTIAKVIKAQSRQDAAKKYIEKLKKEANVSFSDPSFKPAPMPTPGSIPPGM